MKNENKIITVINWLSKSLEETPLGASAKRLTVLMFMICIVYLHIKEVTEANVIWFLGFDIAAVLLIFQIITAENIIQFKNGKKEKEEE